MFSEALKIADKNTVKYMMEELQDKLNESEEERKQAEEKLLQSRETWRRNHKTPGTVRKEMME